MWGRRFLPPTDLCFNRHLEPICHLSTKIFCSAPRPPGGSTTSTPKANRSSTTTATCRPRTWPKTASSGTCSKSRSRATITSGGPCGPTASTSATAPAMRPLMRSFWHGRAPCPKRSATRFTTGRTWSRNAISASTSCSMNPALRASGIAPMRCWPRRAAGARHPAEVPGQSPLHDRRPHRRPGLAQGHRGLEPGNQSLPRFPSGQGAQRAPPRDVQPLGGASGGRQQHQYREADRFSGRAPPAARFLSPDGRPPLRSRPQPRLRRFLRPRRKRRRFSTRRAPDTRPRPRSSAGSPPT